ncbi:phage portal protein [Reinekea sp.]|jgi:HK97 family phage portal protein|uniref:phage portal protein n=1 Tax=Reinekea sp. TaxID=1970455 RepID=UPI00398A3CFC
MWLFNRKSKVLEQQVVDLQHDLANTQNWTLQDSEAFDVLTNGITSAAGLAVNEQTAMSVGAVYACVRLIAGAISGLPIPIYQHTEDGREKVDHPYGWLINTEPNPMWLSSTFWQYIVKSKLLHGDGFAAIYRKGAEVQEIIPLDPRIVEPEKKNGYLIYWVFPNDSDPFWLHQDDVLHFSGLGYDGLRSLSPLKSAARDAIGLSLATTDFSSQFFANGAKPDFAIKAEGKLTDDTVRQLRQTWMEQHSGRNRHLPAILPQGIDIKELTMSAEDAQLLGSRQFQVIDIARIFGVPPFMIGETDKTSSWGTGVESMGIGFVKYTLKPHLDGIEKELRRKLFRRGGPNEKYFPEFNVDGLMRGDSKAQSEYYGKALGGSSGPGYMTVNEIRKLQNLPPVTGGDELVQWSQKNAQKQTNE